MKIVSVLGSPRKSGNSATLTQVITDALTTRGHETITHRLNSLTFKGCQACGACKTTSETCILKDDLAQVLDDVQKADVVILATPVYWGDVSAQMKGFIDRTYSYLTPGFMTESVKHRLSPGKKLVFIQTQGAGDEMYNDIYPRYNTFFEQLNIFEKAYLIRGCNINNPDDVEQRGDLLELARTTTHQLME